MLFRSGREIGCRQRAVVEHQVVHLIILPAEERTQAHRIAHRIAEQQQIAALLAELGFGQLDALHPHGVNGVVVVVVVHRILTEAFAEDIGVGTFASIQAVVAGTADQGVITIVSGQIVVTFSAEQTVVAVISMCLIIALRYWQYAPPSPSYQQTLLHRLE